MLSLCPFVSLKMKRTRIDMTLAPCLNNVRMVQSFLHRLANVTRQYTERMPACWAGNALRVACITY
jgi:hypothetical protein